MNQSGDQLSARDEAYTTEKVHSKWPNANAHVAVLFRSRQANLYTERRQRAAEKEALLVQQSTL